MNSAKVDLDLAVASFSHCHPECSEGGSLVSCSFCNLVYHNSCLGEGKLSKVCLGGPGFHSRSLTSALESQDILTSDDEWACPVCWRHASVQLLVAKRVLQRWTSTHDRESTV